MPRTRSTRLAVAALTSTAAVAAVLAAGPGVSSAHDGAHAEHGSSTAGKQGVGRGHLIAPLRKALRPYEDVEVALDAGFVPTGPCAESPAGGMGFHYTAPARFSEPLEVTRPHVLLYGPTADGGLKLLGAEYMVFDADQDLRTDSDRPVLLGQPFDGPMPGHEPGMPVHYDLHVWTHEANPAGVFAPWNPKVSC
jgi:hypothetical protein